MPTLRTLPRTSLMILALASACAGPSTTETGQPRGGDEVALTPAPAEGIEAELQRMWAAAGVEPSPIASDAEFIRRVSLDLIGRVPTQAEVEGFIASDADDKRGALVDALLATHAHAEHWAALWARELLPGDKQAQRYGADPLDVFLVDALTANRPWAEVVEDLLGREGLVDDDPALAYLAARKLRGQTREDAVAELSSTTARVFLGAKIECAQCHDHPYVPEFSRKDFWAQAAYFGRTTVAAQREDMDSMDMDDMAVAAPKQKKQQAKKKQDKKSPPVIEIRERGKGELRVALGRDDDPRKQPIAPRFLGESGSELDPDQPRREQLAAAIVGNSRFAEATAGWVWTQLLGAGIVEPWDDLLAARERPALLATLAADFRTSDHDLRALIRQVVLSPAYQRSSSGPPGAAGDSVTAGDVAAAEAVFARARVRPLSAEQLFASLLTITALEEVENKAFRRAVRGKKETALREYEFVFADDEMGAADGFSGNVPQALLLLNGGLTNQGVIARSGSSLDRILAERADTDARLEALWLTVYARQPSADELAFGRRAVAEGAASDWEDLMFAMIYSSEFGSNH